MRLAFHDLTPARPSGDGDGGSDGEGGSKGRGGEHGRRREGVVTVPRSNPSRPYAHNDNLTPVFFKVKDMLFYFYSDIETFEKKKVHEISFFFGIMFCFI